MAAVELETIALLDNTILSHPDGPMLLYVSHRLTQTDVAVFKVEKRHTVSNGIQYIASLVPSREKHDHPIYTWNWIGLFRLAVLTLLLHNTALQIGSYSLLPIPNGTPTQLPVAFPPPQ